MFAVALLASGQNSTLTETLAGQIVILSQVIPSLQLSFAVLPLVRFTSDRTKMGRLVNAPWLTILCVLHRDGHRRAQRLASPADLHGVELVVYRRILVPLEHSDADRAILIMSPGERSGPGEQSAQSR